MSELWVKSGNREFEATRDRTELIRYLGDKAVYDHVDINGIPNFKVFKHHEDYDVALEFCEENRYPHSEHQVHVSETVDWFYRRSLENETVDEMYVRESDEVQ